MAERSKAECVEVLPRPGGGGSVRRTVLGDRGTENFRVSPIVEPRSKVWTSDQRWKKYSAKDSLPERFRCGTIQKEVS